MGVPRSAQCSSLHGAAGTGVGFKTNKPRLGGIHQELVSPRATRPCFLLVCPCVSRWPPELGFPRLLCVLMLCWSCELLAPSFSALPFPLSPSGGICAHRSLRVYVRPLVYCFSCSGQSACLGTPCRAFPFHECPLLGPPLPQRPLLGTPLPGSPRPAGPATPWTPKAAHGLGLSGSCGI